MKKQTKTIRICKKLHARIKTKAKTLGMKLESWSEKQLDAALLKSPSNISNLAK